MYRIVSGLYVGPIDMLDLAKERGYAIVGACKYPLHQMNARLSGQDKDGYLKITPDEPEYYYAKREHAIYLNLIDGNKKDYISDKMIDAALEFIDFHRRYKENVFITCNMGTSRSPSIALMYLIKLGYFSGLSDFFEVEKEFKRLYPPYKPNKGINEYTRDFFYKHVEKE